MADRQSSEQCEKIREHVRGVLKVLSDESKRNPAQQPAGADTNVMQARVFASSEVRLS